MPVWSASRNRYLTLRLRGVFFHRDARALAVVVQTLITNWDFVGGAARHLRACAAGCAADRRRVRPVSVPRHAGNMRHHCWRPRDERPPSAMDFAAIRDDEAAAETSGVPTLRLEADCHHALRRLHGHGGRAAAHLRHLPDPTSGFSLNYAVNAIAMPLIGGMGSWVRPLLARCWSAARRSICGSPSPRPSMCWSPAC